MKTQSYVHILLYPGAAIGSDTGFVRNNDCCSLPGTRQRNPKRAGRGSWNYPESDTSASAGTGESTETVMVMAGHIFHWRSVRSGIGRGGSVDDTGRVPFPHVVLSSDLWLIRYRLSELTSGGHLDSYTQTEIRERPATSPSAEPTSRSVQEQAERPVPVAMPPVLYALLYLPRGTRPAL